MSEVQMANLPTDPRPEPAPDVIRPRFLLLGDSHAAAIGKAARADGLPFVGGPIGVGREFVDHYFDVADGDLLFRRPEMDALYRGFLDHIGVDRLARIGMPVVSTLGFGAHFFATRENWNRFQLREGRFEPGFLGSPFFDRLVCTMARDSLGLYRQARDMGLRILGVMPPQRVLSTADPAVFMAAQDSLRRDLEAEGIEVVDVRPQVIDADGWQRPEYCEENDALHGNLAFGRVILDRLAALGI